MPKKRIVVDTSILVAYAKEESHWDRIEAGIGKMQWIAPVAAHFEVGNAIAKALKGHRGVPKISAAGAQAILERYAGLSVGLADVDMALAVGIMAEEDMWAYDAYGLALAFKHDLPLATCDHAMKVHAENIGIEVLHFVPDVRGRL